MDMRNATAQVAALSLVGELYKVHKLSIYITSSRQQLGEVLFLSEDEGILISCQQLA